MIRCSSLHWCAFAAIGLLCATIFLSPGQVSAAEPFIPNGPNFTAVTSPSPNGGPIQGDYATVARAADGSFVVSWSAPSPYEGYYGSLPDFVYAQRFSAQGTPLTTIIQVAPEVPIENLVGQRSEIHTPTVACDADGNFVVAWVGLGPTITHDDGSWEREPTFVYGRLFAADGTPSGPRFPVSHRMDYVEYNVNYFRTDIRPHVAMNADGGFVVVWTGDRTGNPAAADVDLPILMRRFSADGTARDMDPIRVNPVDSIDGQPRVIDSEEIIKSDQRYPVVALDSAGNIVVAWRRYVFFGDPTDLDSSPPRDWLMDFFSQSILMQRFDTEGQPVGKTDTVWWRLGHMVQRDKVLDLNQAPSVAMNSSGDFAVSWYIQQYGVFCRFYTGGGKSKGRELRAASADKATLPRFSSPGAGSRDVACALDDEGTLTLLWRGRIAAGIDEETGGTDYTYQIYGQRVASNGAMIGPGFQVEEAPLPHEYLTNPSMSADADGNAIAIWTKDFTIMAQGYIAQ